MNLRVALIGVVALVFVSAAGAQQTSPSGENVKTTQAPVPVPLDGRWLRSGLQDDKRLHERPQPNDPAAVNVLAITGYVRGVIDVTNSNIALATAMAEKFHKGQQPAKGQKASNGTELVVGFLHACYGMFAPLSSTDYVKANLQMDQIDQIVLNPGGHPKLLHLWPGQNPPPGSGETWG